MLANKLQWHSFQQLVVLLASLSLLPPGSEAVADETRPNVVLIVADDLGWADLKCYGSSLHRTPHLDRLSQQGMRFTQAYAACPVCSPTRASIMTGKWPARLNLTDWLPGRPDRPDQKLKRPVIDQQLPLDEITLAEVFQQAGYTCGSIGKWHLGGSGFGPREQGFHFNIGGDETGTPLNYFAPFRRNQRQMPGLEEAPDGEYLTDRLGMEASRFISENRERPFFLYLPHFAVHTPMRAREDLISKYPTAGVFSGRQNNPIYAAMLESLDEAVGRVLKALDEHHLSDQTIVIFTSDNGGLATTEGPHTPATSNAPLREGKGYLYEGGIRVPLIVRWPGRIPAATTCEVPVQSIDLFPTLTAAAGLKTQAVPDGVSLLPVLRQSGELNREDLYWHYPHYSNQGGRPGAAIRSGEYKLIEFFETGRRELFHVARDLSESRNLSEEKPELVQHLGEKLAVWQQSAGARMMTANPEFIPNPQAANGTITLPARTAEVHGVMLRYEPMPHKNTLGFWVKQDDWASFEFTCRTPGTFSVEALVGCGNGSGGSRVNFQVADQSLSLTVVETGGFQKFVPVNPGEITLKAAGRYSLTVKPEHKPGVAVMDLREIVLKPKAE